MDAALLKLRDSEHKNTLSIEKIPIPVPSYGQVLVRITASGVCHTDLHAIDGDWNIPTTLPLIPGHEGVGIIEQIGPNVVADVNIGDRVGIPWLHSSCGMCEYCVTGREPYCKKQTNTGYTVQGCFSKYVLADANFVTSIPASLTDIDAAPILCAGVTTFTGIKNSGIRTNQFITIIGAAGGLGHLAVQYAVVMGIRVIGVDVGAKKLEFIRSLGAEAVFDGTSSSMVDDILQLTNGGSHAVLCLATHTNALASTTKLVRCGGTIVFIGLPKGDIPINIVELVLRGITLKGSLVGTREDLKEALDIAACGKVRAQIEVDKLDKINHVLDRLRHGTCNGRIVLDMA